MKKIFIVFLLVVLGIAFSQKVQHQIEPDLDGLTEEQKQMYFRSKITIEPAGYFETPTYRNWTAYEGLDKRLSTKEFFSMTGFKPEDKDFSTRTRWPWQVFGYLGIGLGLPMMTAVETAYDDDYDVEEKKPYFIPGLIFFAGGVYSYWYYITHPQLTTYELAREIASEYNKKLIAKMIE